MDATPIPRRIRRFGAVTPAQILLAAVPLLAAGSISFGEPRGNRPKPNPSAPGVASNQSVSIADPDLPRDADRDAATQDASTEPSEGPVESPARASEADSPGAPALADSRTLRRRSWDGDSTAGEDIKATFVEGAWYATGLMPLAIVLAIIAALAWLFRKWIPGTGAPDSSAVRVAARTAVSPKHTVALIQVGRRFILAGISGDRISPLADISDPDEVADLVARTGTANEHAFNQWLAGQARQYDEDPEPPRPGAERAAGVSPPELANIGAEPQSRPAGTARADRQKPSAGHGSAAARDAGQSRGREPADTNGVAGLLRRLRALQYEP